MPSRAIPDEELKTVVETVQAAADAGYLNGKHPSAIAEAAKRLDQREDWVRHRVNRGREKGYTVTWPEPSLTPSDGPSAEQQRISTLEDENKRLRAELASVRKDEITRAQVWEHVTRIAHAKVEPPKWLSPKRVSKKGLLGVPIALWSDWHWGEVVRPTEVNGINAYNLKIAHARARRLVDTTIDLLRNHLTGAQYDGIVLALAGDFFSGSIHEELDKTNEVDVMEAFVDLHRVMVKCVSDIADEFGSVYIPCVTGNHGRTTRRVQAKERYATNFDWLLYAQLAYWFEGDNRVTIDASQAPEVDFRVYGHRYKLVHGDGWSGGDGIIGALGPVTRGRVRKQARDASHGTHWETLICGHWHTLCQLPHLVVNGSLKGYDEYCQSKDLGYEPPAQALWVTHPTRGITIQAPIYVDEPQEREQSPWVSVPRAA